MKKVYNFSTLNEFLNIQSTPQEVANRLSKIAINYARTTNEMMLDDMHKDLDFLQLMIDCFELITLKNEKEERV